MQVTDSAGNMAVVAYRLLNIVCTASYQPCLNPDQNAGGWTCGANGVCGSLATSNLTAAILTTPVVAKYPSVFLAGPEIMYLNRGSGYDRYVEVKFGD